MSSEQPPAAASAEIIAEKIPADGGKVVDGKEEAPAAVAAVAAAVEPSVSSDTVSDIEKKQRRAERFGVEVKFSEDEKRRLRASRFSGLSKNGTTTTTNAEEDKRIARAARFGITSVAGSSQTATTASSVQGSGDEEAKKKARLNRFAGVDVNAENAKKKARAERFASGNEGPRKKLKAADGTATTAATPAAAATAPASAAAATS